MAILTSMIRKESLHLLRDPRTLLVVLVMPIVLLLLFGYAISMEINNIKVAAVCYDHNDATRHALVKLKSNPYIDFRGMASHADTDRLLRRGEADVIVVMKTDNGELRTQLLADASNPSIAKSAVQYVQGVMGGGMAQSPLLMRPLYNPQLKSA